MAVHRGDDGTALILQKGYPKKERGEDGLWELTYLYWCAAASAESLAPALDSAPPGGVHATLKCKRVTIKPHDAPNRVWMEVEYRSNAGTSVSIIPASGTVIQESESSFQEEVVEAGGVDGSMSSANQDTAKSNNARTFKFATITYSRTEYKSSFTWSEANMIQDEAGGGKIIGEVMAPTGMSSPTAGRWLFTGKSVRTINADLFEIRESWTYNRRGWETARPNAYS